MRDNAARKCVSLRSIFIGYKYVDVCGLVIMKHVVEHAENCEVLFQRLDNFNEHSRDQREFRGTVDFEFVADTSFSKMNFGNFEVTLLASEECELERNMVQRPRGYVARGG